MIVIAVIGAGNLGTRHLQALVRLNFPIQIEVVDPCLASLDLAKTRFNQYPQNLSISNVKYLSKIENLSKEIDFAIVATNSDVRAAVIRKLVQFCSIKNMLLEKVLFQRLEDYAEFKELFERNGVQVWVNHPRRQFPFYHKIKQLVQGAEVISYHIQGGAWGLGSNSLHFIDVLSFLTGQIELEISSENLDTSVMQSKRAGFVEFSGLLQGRLGKNPFTFYCGKYNSPLIASIYTHAASIIIDESSGWFRLATKKEGWVWGEHKEQITCYQSELTQKVIEDVIGTGVCDLPVYADSALLHYQFVSCIKSHLERTQNRGYDNCPIT